MRTPSAPPADRAAALAGDPALAEAAARIHGRAFGGDAPGRAWSAAEFADLCALPGALALLAPDPAPGVAPLGVLGVLGVLVGRVAGPEAELITLAVDPDARRLGLGRALADGFARLAAAAGAEEAFLEVAETNAPARALYRALGWAEVGRRRGYYRDAAGSRIDALAMRLELAPRRSSFGT